MPIPSFDPKFVDLNPSNLGCILKSIRMWRGKDVVLPTFSGLWEYIFPGLYKKLGNKRNCFNANLNRLMDPTMRAS